MRGAAVDQVKASRWLEAHSALLSRPLKGLFNKVPEAIAMRKGDVDVLNVVNSWIVHHRTSGWLGGRRRYWFETRDWASHVGVDLETVAACAASFEPDPY